MIGLPCYKQEAETQRNRSYRYDSTKMERFEYMHKFSFALHFLTILGFFYLLFSLGQSPLIRGDQISEATIRAVSLLGDGS